MHSCISPAEADTVIQYRRILAASARHGIGPKKPEDPPHFLSHHCGSYGKKPGIWRFVVNLPASPRPDGTPEQGVLRLGIRKTSLKALCCKILCGREGVATTPMSGDYPDWGPRRSRPRRPFHDPERGAGKVVGVVDVDTHLPSVLQLRERFRQNGRVCSWSLGLLPLWEESTLVAWQAVTSDWHAGSSLRERSAGATFRRRSGSQHGRVGFQWAEAFNQMTLGLHQRELYKRQFERYVGHQIAEIPARSRADLLAGAG